MEYLFAGLRQSVLDAVPLREHLAEQTRIPHIDRVAVARQAIDARRKPDVYYVYTVRFTVTERSARLDALLANNTVVPYVLQQAPPPEPRMTLPEEPIIVGFGPAGMFLGLALAEMGYRPIIFERGDPVEDRARAVAGLWHNGQIDTESNLQFGEGGAGTWSDGKLTTGKSSPIDRQILDTFVRFGAPEEILFAHRPHIGTDHLRTIVAALRGRIESLGGSVHFRHKLTDIETTDGAVSAVTVSGQRIATQAVVLAIGHSARDTVAMLARRGVAMETKPFAMGTRIEHPAERINEAQYGAPAAAVLPAADYKLTYRAGDVGVYSFCMCPGGQVVCAASECDGQVSNGMSHYARASGYSNSALVVSVDPQRLLLSNPLDAIDYQRELERRAFAAGGGGFVAPAQTAADLMRARDSQQLPETTYLPGMRPARLDEVLPKFIAEALRSGLRRFDRTIPGFIEHGTLIGVETRTSSPVRLLRDDNHCSISARGLYLLGEGAGYAGGIMTCARDALHLARLVVPRS